MKKFGQKFSALILVLTGMASVSTAAYALKVEIYHGTTLVYSVDDAKPPAMSGDPICNVAPCTGANGKLVTITIPSGSYPAGNPKVQVLAGARGEAKIETSATTIGASTTINNTLNVVGTFRMLVAGDLKVVTSSDFTLRPGTTSTLSGGGTWQALGRGASKCDKNSAGSYVNSLCTISDNSVDSTNASNDCTLCRSYGFTDTGYVLRLDQATGSWTKPASGVVVTMTSDVTFNQAASTATYTEAIGTPLSTTIPSGSLAEDGRFYVNLQRNELVPCEPFLEPCENKEKKTSTIAFQGMSANDQVNFPATSTDLGTSEFGNLLAQLNKVEVPIDVHPTDPVPDPNNPGFYLPGTNNDFGQSEGQFWVLALRTPEVDTCLIVPFDGQTPLAFLSVAGSDLVPLTQANQYSVNGVCIGLRLQFDRSAIKATIEGSTEAEKQATCNASPIATLIIKDAVEQQTTYTLTGGKGGGKKASYEPGPECTVEGNEVTCQVSVPLVGSQVVKCSVPAGG